MAGSKIQAFWNHPAGPKTIHFWAPTFKWAISIANVADFSKPPEQLSYPHQSVVAVSGLIWSRYSTQIIPTKQVKSNAALVKVFLEEMHGIRQCPYRHMEKEKYLKNWNLVSVNLTMAATGFYQLSRKIQHDYYPEAETAEAKE